jgi:hypothetical protein
MKRTIQITLAGDKQATMPPIDPKVEILTVWHCRYRTLRPIQALRRLTDLIIASYPDDTLEFLSSLKHLRDLRIMHLPHVRDLSPLAELRQLETLGLATLPSWDASGRVTEVRSLAPLARMRGLKYLALFGVVPKGRSLAAIARCPKLVTARLSKYPKAEMRRFYERTGISDDPLLPPAG